MATYVVATKREARGEGISAEERLRDVAGASVKRAGSADRVLVEMSAEVARDLQLRFGEKLLVEPIIKFDPLSPSQDE